VAAKENCGSPERRSTMRRPLLLIPVLGALLLAGPGASAGGSPVVNEILHFSNEPFVDIGVNCGTGNLSQSNGLFSGVIRTFVTRDGTVRSSTHTRGTDTLDDLPTDGFADATTTFVFNTVDSVFSSGKEIHTFTGAGTLTLVATGEGFRFHAVAQLVVGENGDVKVNLFRIVCD
jgi:hypothetical protein